LERLKRFLKKRFPSWFYEIESNVIYSTEDDLLMVYKDMTLEIIVPETLTTFVFDITEIDNETVGILRQMDPFKVIFELPDETLEELREKYEKEDEFEICQFITNELKRRSSEGV